MKKLLLIPLLFLFTSCASTDKTAVESRKINEFFEKSFDDKLKRNPMYETYVGGKRNYHKLDDISDAAQLREHEIIKKELEELKRFDYENLNQQAKISYDLFKYMHERTVRNFIFRFHNYPVNQMFGVQSRLPSFMVNTHRVESDEDARAYISRLNEFKGYLGEIVKGLKAREKRGIVAPHFVYDKALRDIDNVLRGKPFSTKGESLLYADFKKKVKALDPGDDEEKEFIESAEKALLNSVGPGFRNLSLELKRLKKKAPKQAGASRMPNGKAYYKSMLEFHTSTDMSAKEIHEIGLKEVSRIHGEMLGIMVQVDFKGSLQDFFKHIQTAPQFRFAQNKEGRAKYLRETEKIIAGMKERLEMLFNIHPKADLIVKPVEPYREKSTGLAFYEGPSNDGKRPGIYYINLSNMKAANSYEMEALAYHEAIPGHHMQISIATELKGIPRFRKYAWMTAYTEGWGLYAELLPRDIGLYKDPYSNFGRLAMELTRAVRLVVDTGLHDKGWTREKTIKYIMKNSPTGEVSATRATERYLVMPGQATAYKIGMIKFIELKNYAREHLSTMFDIREFHDEVLRHGPMTLDMLEKKVKSWVAAKKGIAE